MLEGDNAYLFMRRRRDNPSPETFPESLKLPAVVLDAMVNLRYRTQLTNREHAAIFARFPGERIIAAETLNGNGFIIGEERNVEFGAMAPIGKSIIDVHTHRPVTIEQAVRILQQDFPNQDISPDDIYQTYTLNRTRRRFPSPDDVEIFLEHGYSSSIVASADATAVLVKSFPLRLRDIVLTTRYGDISDRISFYDDAFTVLVEPEGENILQQVLAAVIYPYGSLYFSKNIRSSAVHKVAPDMSRIVDPPVFADPVRTWREGRRRAKTKS